MLADVRAPEEYRPGHIPGSENISLSSLDKIRSSAENKDIPIYVYCRSGSRSRQAAQLLSEIGYVNMKNIGGISAYSGKVER